MRKWEKIARGQALLASINPDHVPEYRVPARRWWQIWKPKWKWEKGVSHNQIMRAHGIDPSARTASLMTTDELFKFFGL